MQNLQNLQNKYFSIFLKNMLKYDEHPGYTPTGSRISSGCSSYFLYKKIVEF